MKRRSARALPAVLLFAVATCSDPAPTTGAMIVEISGLPASVVAAVIVRGPAGFQRAVPATTTIEALLPGEYTVSSALITSAIALYEPQAQTRTVTIVAGRTESVPVAYVLASGSLDVTTTGLPAGVNPYIAIVSPTYVRTVTTAGLIHAIPPGQYVVRADTFAALTGDRFGATVVEQPLTITASETPVSVTVAYGPASGTLNLAVTGLAVSTHDAISVTGPGGFSFLTSTSSVLRGLRPGQYTVSPRQIIQCPSIFTPATTAQAFDVVIAQVTDAAVAYQSSQPGPETLNLSIQSAYLTQAVQSVDGTVPIIAGRPALLRVFGIANQCNAAAPAVRVRFPDGDSLTISAPASSVPFQASPTQLTASWNALLPSGRVNAGLTFEVEIDPGNAIAEENEADNTFPSTGTSTPVIDVPAFNVNFVPITQAGVTGNVTEANVPEYLRAVNQMLPLGVINTTIAAPFTTQIVLGSGTSSVFAEILQELEAKRIQDGATAHYYGVLMPAPGINFVQVGGIAYVGGRTALGITVGWFANARQATELVAHELTHNFGQRHAPCGGAGNPDPSFPYPGGAIGVTGYDLSLASEVAEIIVKPPSTPDIMGYCSNPWISDYMYGRIINFRGPAVAATAAREMADPRMTILVSGMISPDSVRLDPAFQITTRPVLPVASGPHTLEGYATDGRLLFRTAFEAQPTDHGNPSVRHFTFAIPLSDEDVAALSRVEFVGGGRRATRTASGLSRRLRLLAPGAAADSAGVSVSSRTSGTIDVVWDVARWPAILVRDPETNGLLAIGRDGRASVATRGRSVQLVLSDGARSMVVESAIAGR